MPAATCASPSAPPLALPSSPSFFRLQEYQPYSRVDITDETPAMGQVFRILYTMKFWLEWDASTVLVLHCNTGVMRTGFVLAAYLAYSGEQQSMDAALNFFSEARIGDASLRDRMLPSWRYLLREMDRHLREPPSLPRVHALSYVVCALGSLRGYLNDDYPTVQLYQGPKVLFDSSKDCMPDDTIRWEDDKLIVETTMLASAAANAASASASASASAGSGAASGDGAVTDLTICGDYQLWILLPDRQKSLWTNARSADSIGPGVGGRGGRGRRGTAGPGLGEGEGEGEEEEGEGAVDGMQSPGFHGDEDYDDEQDAPSRGPSKGAE
jgi:hypothetical protein